MTINEKIVNALAPFGLPVTTDFYGGGKNEYFTFDYADYRAEDFGDDCPIHVVASLQIHLFLPRYKDYLTLRSQVQLALFDAGFTFPAVTEFVEQSIQKSDKDIRHLIFECEIEDEDFGTLEHEIEDEDFRGTRKQNTPAHE